MPGAALTVTAQFDPRTFDIIYELNDGTINRDNVTEYTYGQGATLPTDVTKTGSTFKGWYNNAALTGAPVTAISATDTGDKKYWAKWEANTLSLIHI